MKIIISISLVFLLFLLTTNFNPVLAGQTYLNSTLSVNIPELQRGDPGDFITFVLEFENSGSDPLNLDVSFGNEAPWSIIGDPQLTIPPHTKKFYYPVTVQIPANTPANMEKLIQIRFRQAGEVFTLPPVTIDLIVNPISQMDFDAPTSGTGLNNSTVTYPVTIRNNGNTLEKVTLDVTSENNWTVQTSTQSIDVKPGTAQTITITHKIPSFTEVGSDIIKIKATWSNGQKQFNIVTAVVNKNAQLGVNNYLWDGHINLSHPDLTAVNPFNLSFSLEGRWAPDSIARVNMSDILNPNDRRWFVELQPRPWTLKTGNFPFFYSGMVNPVSSDGRFTISRLTDTDFYAIEVWESTSVKNLYPTALQASWEKHSTWRFLSDPTPAKPLNVLEWSHWENPTDSLRISNSLSWNLAGPNNLNDGGYAAFIGLNQSAHTWNWDFGSQYFHNLNNYRYRSNNWLAFYQPADKERLYTNWQIKSDNFFDTQNHTNLFLQGMLYWPNNYRLRSTYEYQSADTQPFNARTEFFLETYYDALRWKNRAWISLTTENNPTGSRFASKLNWLSTYPLNQKTDFILNPQLMIFCSPQLNDDFSQLAVGSRWRWTSDSELTALYHQYLNSGSRQMLELIFNYKYGDYRINFNYTADWQSQTDVSDTLSLYITRKFTVPVPKPLAALEGIAFIDSNHNGLFDEGETPVVNLGFLIDKLPFQTDTKGHYRITGLEPGPHQVTINSRLDVVYRMENPSLKIELKPYQTSQANIPLIRTQNLTGTVFLDQNQDQRQNENERSLASIGVVLKDPSGNIIQKTFTSADGNFTIYQLAPGDYTLSIDPETLPEDVQIPPGLSEMKITQTLMEKNPILELGLIPFEKPIEIVTPSENTLNITLDKELVTAGGALQITIESGREIQKMTLVLPGNQKVPLDTAPSQTQWIYHWKIPGSVPPGQTKVACEATDPQGISIGAEVNLIILGQDSN